MQSLRSVFISFYAVFCVLFCIVFFFLLAEGQAKSIYYTATFASTLIPCLYFIYIYVKKPREVGLLMIMMFSFVGAAFLIVLGQYFTEIQDTPFPLFIAGGSLLGWILYATWYGKFKNRKLKENLKKMEVFNLVELNGSEYRPDSSSKFRLFIFVRGSWCPFCSAQIRDFIAKMDEMDKRAVEVNFVLPKHARDARIWESHWKGKANLLFDADMKLSASMGIDLKNSLPLGLSLFGYEQDNLMPTSILTDASMQVVHVHETLDYKKRPEPEFFLRIVDSLA